MADRHVRGRYRIFTRIQAVGKAWSVARILFPIGGRLAGIWVAITHSTRLAAGAGRRAQGAIGRTGSARYSRCVDRDNDGIVRLHERRRTIRLSRLGKNRATSCQCWVRAALTKRW
jgi:hypothetical protein